MAARIAWLVLIVCFVLVAGIQAAGALVANSEQPAANAEASQPAEAPEDASAGGLSEAAGRGVADPPAKLFEMMAKITLATSADMQDVQSVEELEQAAQLLSGFARSNADRVRSAIITAELGRGIDPDAAVARARLESLAERFAGPSGDQSSEIEADVRALADLYSGAAMDDATSARLAERYPFFGPIALAFDRGAGDTVPQLEELSGLVTLLLVVTIAIIGLLALGCILLITALVALVMGRLRGKFAPPMRGGSVYLEAAAVFVAGFLLLQGVLGLVAVLPLGPTAQTLVALGLQWLLLLAAAWPLVRGESTRTWAKAIGLHAGDAGIPGFIKEVLLGVVGWVAAVPLFLAAGLVSGLLAAAWQFISGLLNPDEEASRPLPDASVFELVGSGNTAVVIAVAALATIWAPLAEELIFRGCLYRHLRGRLGVIVSALIVAVIFGFMHGYGPLYVLPVLTLGFCFAIMREWRGSLVAPITAHLLHNAMGVTFMITATRLLG